MSLDVLLQYAVSGITKQIEEKYKKENEPKRIGEFVIEKKVKQMIPSVKQCVEYHRGREKHYIEKLELAEKELKENGIRGEWVNQQGLILHCASGAVLSGAMFSNLTNTGNIGYQNSPHSAVNFVPKVDQALMDAVTVAKDKVQHHCNQATIYEKWLRAFTVAPADMTVKLSVDDIHFFRLEN